MWSWINAVVDLVAQYPAWALLVAFLAAIIEAVAVLGILIPGTPILMAVTGAAAMSGQPMLPFLTLSIMARSSATFCRSGSASGSACAFRACGRSPAGLC
jgi:membrane protein DedA with SNARE-associated domain